MTTAKRPRKELLTENEFLRSRLEEAEETLRAIGLGEVDAFVVSGPEGEQVFTLKGAEQPYRFLVETMNEGAAILAADGTILYSNNRLAVLLQVPLERLIGTKFGSYVAPADQALLAARLARYAPEYATDEIALLTGTGVSVPALISSRGRDLSGSREISVVVTDLSQQKRTEEIMDSEKLARSIIEQAGEASVVCDEAGRIIRANRHAQQLCGENPLLQPFDALFPLLIRETGCLFSLSATLRGVGIERAEVEFDRSDAGIFHLLLTATPLKSVQDRIIGCVVTLADFTKRKQAERALRQSQEQYRSLFNTLHDGFCIIEVLFDANDRPIDYRFLEINPAFETQTGLRNAQGKLMRELAPELEAHWFEIFGKVALTGEPAHFVNEAKALNRWYEVCAYRVDARDSRKVAILFNDITEAKRAEAAQDTLHEELEERVAERTKELSQVNDQLRQEITERHTAEENLRKLNEELTRSNRDLEQFAYAASHDLQEPLRMVASYTELLARRYGGQLDEQGHTFITYAIEGATRLKRLIDDLLVYSRVGTAGRQRAPTGARAVVAEALRNLQASLEESGALVTVGDLPTVRADSSQLTQLFQNLVGNAIKFRRPGEALRIVISAENFGEEWRFSVQDNGIGIDPQYADKVFDIFQRLHSREEYPGTGIGLALCKRIVERHGGRIWVESTPGQGATFHFTLGVPPPDPFRPAVGSSQAGQAGTTAISPVQQNTKPLSPQRRKGH